MTLRMKKQMKTFGLTTVIVVTASTFLILMKLPSMADGNRRVVEEIRGKSDSAERADKPMIIWWQAPLRDPNIVRQVLKHGIFSHVMVVGLHRYDNRPYHKKAFVRETIRLCKERGVKVIWTRWLYPGYGMKYFKNEDAFDPAYYILEIREIRKEAHMLGADFVAFDTEPNAKASMKELKHRKLTKQEFERMDNAIRIAVEKVGPVDFVLPAGRSYREHMYNAARRLGKYVVAEFTYYDRPGYVKNVKIPYDIFGVFVSVNKENKTHPNLPFFTPREILSKQYLWSRKMGLFVYPGHTKNTIPVAEEFSKITSIDPIRDINDIK